MAKMKSKWINRESFHFDTSENTNLKLLFDAAGAISATASGLKVVDGGITNDMLAGSIASSKLADEAVIAFLNQNETVTGSWTFSTDLPQSSIAPTADDDFTNKAYVDSVAAGLDPKESVTIATTADVGGTYSSSGGTGGTGEFTGVDLTSTSIFDGLVDADSASITLAVGDRILVKDQSTPSQNGLYVVTTAGASGVIERATDHDGSPSAEVSGGNFTYVENGAANVNAGFVLQGDGILTLNTDDIIWVQFSGAGQLTAGTGLTKTGNTIDFNAADDSLTVNANDAAVNVDGVYVVTTTSGVTIEANSLTNDRLVNDDVTFTAGNGLNGGGAVALGGSATLDVDPEQLISGGDAEIDGDRLLVDNVSPSNYTPATNMLSAHLIAIDGELAGHVDGPGSSTDNHLVRWDGATGQLIQDSNSSLDDNSVMTIGVATSGQLLVNGQAYSATHNLTYGANIATDSNESNVFDVTLTGNAQLDNPTNLKDGATYVWMVRQDGVGGHTLTFDTAWVFVDGNTPTLSTGANAVDIITAVSDGTNLYASILSDIPVNHADEHITGGEDVIDGDQLDITWAPINYTPSTSPSEVSLSAHLTAHLAGIDSELGALAGAEVRTTHVISGGEDTAGFFTLGTSPIAGSIKIFVISGPDQVNSAWSPTATPDYELLNTNELHFNNNGAATGLSADMSTGDELVIFYIES